MKTKNLKSHLMMAALSGLMLLGIACKKDYSTPTQNQAVIGVQLSANAKFGNVLTDNNGRSLYFFFNDNNSTTSACNGTCLVTWTPFYVATPTISTGLSTSDFATITRADGAKQTTYKGWPLYYYAHDVNAGDTNGDGVAGLWVIGKADYSVLMINSQLVGLDGVAYNDQGVAATGNTVYFVDGSGRTLYRFQNDTHNTNNFTKADLSNDTVWPMYQVTGVGSIPSMLDKTQFSTITVFGKTQLVYKGHPMYNFGQDAGVRGSTKGVSFPTPGAGIWKVFDANTPAL